jgi:hypothetical protein
MIQFAMPRPCRAAKCLECVFTIWFTQCSHVWFTLAMLLSPCRSTQGHGTARPSRRPVGCHRSASSGYHSEFHENCYQKHTNLRCKWPLWNITFIAVEETLTILVQGYECLYNLQHKDYDNNLVKDTCWKEIVEVHAQGKEQATQYFVYYRKAYWWYVFVWYYSDNVTALFISVEERKSKWARLRSYYRKALRRREPTRLQSARKVKKWQMRFLQNHFQERGWAVIKMIHVRKFKKSNFSIRIVTEFDNEGKSRYFIRSIPTRISVLMSTTNYYIFIRVGRQHTVSVFRVYLNKNTKAMQTLETSVTTH